MYANSAKGKTISTANTFYNNTITVTPIKLDISEDGSYTLPNNSVAVAATSINNVRRGGITGIVHTQTTTAAAAAASKTTSPSSNQQASGLTTISMPFGHQTNIVTTTTANASNATNNVSVTSGLATVANTGATPKETKSNKATRAQVARKPPPTVDNFWPNIKNDVNSIQHVDAKHQVLPLARIKKIMKLDENAKMIAAEAPLLFAKACEYFIQELTMRAWIHTEESKRRTLQRSDIAQAIANYDQFDFLIDIVPREDIKPPPTHKKDTTTQNTPNTPTNASSSCTSSSAANGTSSNVTTMTVTNTGIQQLGANTATTLKLDGTTEILSFGATSQDVFATHTQQQLQQQLQTQQQQQQHQVQPQQQLQIIQQTGGGHLGAQQLQYFIALPGQQAGQAQIVQQIQQTHHHQQQQQQQQQQAQQQHHHQQHTQLANGLGLNIVAQAQPTQQLILTAGPNGQLTATPAPSAATAAQQQTALLQNFAQHHHQQQQQQQQQQQAQQQAQQQHQQQQIQLLQQVVGPNGELTNVPITINANQLNLLRLQMQQQQQQQQHVAAAATQQQVIIPTQLLTHQQFLQLSGNATTTTSAAAAAAAAAAQQQQQHHQQQQQQQHQQTLATNSNNSSGNQQQPSTSANTTTNIFLSTSAQGTQTHQHINNGSSSSSSNSSSATSTATVASERNLGNTYRQNC